MSYSIFFDFESGGLESRHPSIQLAAIAVNDSDWSEVDHFERKIKFNEPDADPEALRINHYDRQTWQREAIMPTRVCFEFAKWSEPYRCIQMISKRTGQPYLVGKLAGHNALAFDLPRLRELFGASFFPFSYHVKDTLQRALFFFDENPHIARPESLKLTTLCSALGINCDGAHDALTDVRLSAALARKFCELAKTGGLERTIAA